MDGEMISFIAHPTKCFILFCSAHVRPPIWMWTQLWKGWERWGFVLTPKFLVWRCGEQLGWDTCGQDTCPSAVLFSVTVTSLLAPGTAGICARCSTPWEVRKWQILAAQTPGILSGDEIFCNKWGRICPFLCGKWNLWKHKRTEVNGRKIKQIPLSSACSQCFQTELL